MAQLVTPSQQRLRTSSYLGRIHDPYRIRPLAPAPIPLVSGQVLRSSILPALLLGLVSVAFADTVELGSFGNTGKGLSNFNNANTALVYQGYSWFDSTPAGAFFKRGVFEDPQLPR
jgi:hypothetical protein